MRDDIFCIVCNDGVYAPLAVGAGWFFLVQHGDDDNARVRRSMGSVLSLVHANDRRAVRTFFVEDHGMTHDETMSIAVTIIYALVRRSGGDVLINDNEFPNSPFHIATRNNPDGSMSLTVVGFEEKPVTLN
jgi:hypothetical protein